MSFQKASLIRIPVLGDDEHLDLLLDRFSGRNYGL